MYKLVSYFTDLTQQVPHQRSEQLLKVLKYVQLARDFTFIVLIVYVKKNTAWLALIGKLINTSEEWCAIIPKVMIFQ